MVRFMIDNRNVEVPEGGTVLDGARKLGIFIPTLCFLEGRAALTSCMVCLVRVKGEERMVPACGTVAEEGMQVESEIPAVHAARRTALELLLSEHGGDCLGPCHTLCPAWMDIPRMILQVVAGSLDEAIQTVKADMALPAVVERICPAPCEIGCRRAVHDAAVSIRNLVKHVADADLASEVPFRPERKPDRKERVAIVGAGPAGLSAAYYLRLAGFGCTIFDDHELPGGMLRYGVPEDALPRDVLDKEISLIAEMSVEFRLGSRIGKDLSLAELRKDFDAVLLATGAVIPDQMKELLSEFEAQETTLALKSTKDSVTANRWTFETCIPGIFAAGDVLKPGRLAARSMAQGKRAALSICRFLSGEKVEEIRRPFTTRLGKLKPGEMEQFLAGVSAENRIEPASSGPPGFTREDAVAEGKRCLRCDCAGLDNCTLREYSVAYGARAGRYGGERLTCEIRCNHPEIIFEPGKCIACGICVQITGEASEALGLTFVGRGFDVRVAVPFDGSLEDGFGRVAAECIAACPTGALVRNYRNRSM